MHNTIYGLSSGRIRGAIELLTDFPRLGRARDEEVRVLPIVTYPYAVYYSVDEDADEVAILHVRHGRRRPPAKHEL